MALGITARRDDINDIARLHHASRQRLGQHHPPEFERGRYRDHERSFGELQVQISADQDIHSSAIFRSTARRASRTPRARSRSAPASATATMELDLQAWRQTGPLAVGCASAALTAPPSVLRRFSKSSSATKRASRTGGQSTLRELGVQSRAPEYRSEDRRQLPGCRHPGDYGGPSITPTAYSQGGIGALDPKRRRQ